MLRKGTYTIILCTPVCIAYAEKKTGAACPADSFRKVIAKYRVMEDEIRKRWVKDEENWRKLPARAWPEYQPDLHEIPKLRLTMKDMCKENSPSCRDAKFNLATALLFNHVDHEEGMKLYESLAAEGDVRGMTAVGICLTEGFGCTRDDEHGSKWLQKASQLNFVQGIYEVATLHYTGTATPYVKEDVRKAFELFQQAASHDHASALYMVADMLMSGEGTEKDWARAVDLLYQSGEKGHRFARSTLLRLLREEQQIAEELVRHGGQN